MSHTIWLTETHDGIRCMRVADDETTAFQQIDSLTLDAAEAEITGRLIDEGYTPTGQWSGNEHESQRTFELKA